MADPGPVRLLIGGLLLATIWGCSGRPQTLRPSPTVPTEYSTLPDTAVCVIDRSNPRGLTEIPGKKGPNGVLVFSDGEVRSLAEVHPVNVIAGYAGAESWLLGGDRLQLQGRPYVPYGGERRVAPNLLVRTGEHAGILLFRGAEDGTPPDAIYVPTAPGCIFQAYVWEDLVPQQ